MKVSSMTLRLIALLSVLLAAAPAWADKVTTWTALADRIGQGSANWRTLAIMHQAMHDAWNAADPRYARWFPAEAGEPGRAGVNAEAAMAAAARRVLMDLHPDSVAWIEAAYAAAAQDPRSRALGEAIGAAAVARRQGDGFERRHAFPAGAGPGRWRPAPAEFATSNTTETRPFLFAKESDNPAVPPPPPGSKLYEEGVAEALRVGGSDSTERTAEQTDAAFFWAYQSSQRGFVILGATLLDAHPRPGGLAEHARIMSQLASAMADSAILTWFEKERFNHWRPITIIRETVAKEHDWTPLIATPPHPEYPSGHATDCFAGAFTLQRAMPDLVGPVTYVVQLGAPPEDNVGMGQHPQSRPQAQAPRRVFSNLAAAAEECSDSRIWSGAHIRAADEESRRLGRMIAERAGAAVPGVR